MHEIRLLKKVRADCQQSKANATQLYDSSNQVTQSLQQWMTTQHNCALRGISPFLAELSMDGNKTINNDAEDTLDQLDEIIEGLMADESEVQNLKNEISDLQNSCAPSGNASNQQKNITKDLEKRLVDKTSELNSKFIAKEVRKIIRCKMGLTSILDRRITLAQQHLKILKAQRQLVDLVPEAYERETFFTQRVSVTNLARDILGEFRRETKEGGEDVEGKVAAAPKPIPAPPALSIKSAVFSQRNDESINNSSIEEIASDESLMVIPPSSPSPTCNSKDCSCLGLICCSDKSRLSTTPGEHTCDTSSFPSFLYNSHDCSDGSKYFLGEMAKNCSIIARQISGLSLSAHASDATNCDNIDDEGRTTPKSSFSNDIQTLGATLRRPFDSLTGDKVNGNDDKHE